MFQGLQGLGGKGFKGLGCIGLCAAGFLLKRSIVVLNIHRGLSKGFSCCLVNFVPLRINLCVESRA